MKTTHDNRIRPTRGARADLEATKPSAQQYTDDTDIDAPRWFLAALVNGSRDQALAMYRWIIPDDLDVPDGIIYEAVMAVADAGHDPAPPLVHQNLADGGVFARQHGGRVKSRMLAVTTTSASPLQARPLAEGIVATALRRRGVAAGEGIVRAFGTLPIDEVLPYMVEQGRAVRALDDRRRAIGGDAA